MFGIDAVNEWLIPTMQVAVKDAMDVLMKEKIQYYNGEDVRCNFKIGRYGILAQVEFVSVRNNFKYTSDRYYIRSELKQICRLR